MIVQNDSSFRKKVHSELSLSPSSLNFFSYNDLNGPLGFFWTVKTYKTWNRLKNIFHMLRNFPEIFRSFPENFNTFSESSCWSENILHAGQSSNSTRRNHIESRKITNTNLTSLFSFFPVELELWPAGRISSPQQDGSENVLKFSGKLRKIRAISGKFLTNHVENVFQPIPRLLCFFAC